MKNTYTAALALTFAALSMGQAMAADPVAVKSRDQVRAEMLEAQRSGNVVADDELAYAFGATPGVKLNELFPSRYAAKGAVAAPLVAKVDATQGLTRAQVRSQAVQARVAGDVVADSDLAYSFGATPGVKLNELFPGRYVSTSTVSAKNGN